MKTTFETNKRGELQIQAEACFVIGDLHIPQQDDKIIESLIFHSQISGVDTLIINGDFTNSDVFSEFARKQTNAGWEVEKTECRKVMARLQKQFKKIFFILGNHDSRLLRKTGYALQINDILRIIVDNYDPNQIIATDHDHVLLNDDWLICHPREYSRTPGSVAKKIGEKYERNVIAGHSHILSHTIIGDYGILHHYIDGGCAVDFDKVEYSIMNTSTFTPWTKGFVKIVNGQPIILTEDVFARKHKTVKYW